MEKVKSFKTHGINHGSSTCGRCILALFPSLDHQKHGPGNNLPFCHPKPTKTHKIVSKNGAFRTHKTKSDLAQGGWGQITMCHPKSLGSAWTCRFVCYMNCLVDMCGCICACIYICIYVYVSLFLFRICLKILVYRYTTERFQ